MLVELLALEDVDIEIVSGWARDDQPLLDLNTGSISSGRGPPEGTHGIPTASPWSWRFNKPLRRPLGLSPCRTHSRGTGRFMMECRGVGVGKLSP